MFFLAFVCVQPQAFNYNYKINQEDKDDGLAQNTRVLVYCNCNCVFSNNDYFARRGERVITLHQ